MTARPSGAFCSPPSPRPSDIGSMPMIMARAVISTGRSRVAPAARAALRASCPSRALVVGEGDHQDAVGRGHADAHDRPHQGRHADGRLGHVQHPQDAGQRPGQGREDDERVEPALEVDHHQEVDQQHREHQAGRQPGERAVHALHLAAHDDDLFGREKFGNLPKALSEKGSRTHAYEVGDIAYWSPAHDVAIYYRQDSESIPSPGIIPIGKIDGGTEVFNVPASVKVTIELAE